MNCPRCNQAVEPGAAYCGNCGQALQTQRSGSTAVSAPFAAAGAAATAASVPAYALSNPTQHIGETKALLAVIFGVVGLAGALFMALVGLVFGLLGLVMGTMSRHSTRRHLSTIGLILSGFAVLVSLGVWAYAIKNDPQLHSQAPRNNAGHQLEAPANASSSLSTPCYSTNFVDTLNITNANNSCDMGAFNGPTLSSSSNLYKVYANKTQISTTAGFQVLAKQALEKDVQTNLPTFTIKSEQLGEFAGSPAYFVTTTDATKKIALVEAAVFHQAASGENVFILVHAVNGAKTDLNTMEAQWQWK